MRNLAVITARAGSKGVKDKNIRNLKGKPLLAYSIKAAKEADIFDEIMVSTDSQVYAKIARQYGASVPFIRSEQNANDTATSWDVIKEVINKYSKINKYFDTVTLLQPTSPLRTAGDIRCGFEKLIAKNAKLVVSVCEMDHSPLWANTLPKDRSMKGFIKPEVMNKTRQEMLRYYRINGALYIIKVDHLFGNSKNIYEEDSYSIIMPRERSIDIDEEIDFIMADAILGFKS